MEDALPSSDAVLLLHGTDTLSRTGDLLHEKLNRGDTFHLLSFSGSPELETAVTLADERAAEKAFGQAS